MHRDDVIVDLDQNPISGRGRMTTEASRSFGTLICHGTLWHLQLARPMVAVEICRMHCWPVGDYEMATTACTVDIWNCLRSGIITCRELTAFIGDRWHLRVVGSWIMRMLANLVRTDAPLCRQPVNSEDDKLADDVVRKRSRLCS